MSINFKPTDLRDKVYGLLGLLQNFGLYDGVTASLKSDYSRPLTEVFIDATRALVEHGKSLNFLHMKECLRSEKHDDNRETMPSWVARLDWVIDIHLGSPPTIDGVGSAHNGITLEHYFYISPDSAVLSVNALIVDEIVNFANPLNLWLFSNRRALADLVLDTLFLVRDATPDWTENERMTAWEFVITAGLNHERSDALRDDNHVADAWAFIEEMMSYAVAGHETNNTMGDSARFSSAMIGNSVNRRFFITKGRRIGLGPPNIERGDRVCILFGSSVPHVLRQKSSSWTFLGSAYLYGIMQVQVNFLKP